MKNLNRTLLILALSILVAGSVWSRQETQPEGKQEEPTGTQSPLGGFKVAVEVNMVTVPVTVRKPEGGFIKGLSREDFRVYEDGILQEISTFAQEGLPIRIAIVLDISGTIRSAWGTVMHATRRFVENLHPEDQFSLYTFNSEIRLRMDWGRKTDRIDAVLGSIFCKDNTKLWDTVWMVSSNAYRGMKEKKAMIIMSDGMDNESYYSFEEAVEAAVRSGAVVYVVSKTEAVRQMYKDYKRDSTDPYFSIPQDAFVQADRALRYIAYKTGGRVLYPNLFGQLDDIYGEVNEELRNQYSIGYVSNNPVNDGSYRNIEVRVNAPGAVIVARPGYYAPDEIPSGANP
jgi:Ca-activated chloride channel family protein